MEQQTLIPMQTNKYPKNAKQRAEYEQEIAEEIADDMDKDDMLAYLIADKLCRLYRVALRMPQVVSPDWMDAFSCMESKARIARHLARRCKMIIASMAA